jgi:hypothetical protein
MAYTISTECHLSQLHQYFKQFITNGSLTIPAYNTNPWPIGNSVYINGAWQTQPRDEATTSICRYEPSPITKEVTLTDGSLVRYKGIAYLPLSTPDIEYQSLITIIDKNGNLVVESKTLYFYRGEMNCTLYI